jgi:catechol 2,3-dioxygenase-like lactoylglutathione lyase family enzyme
VLGHLGINVPDLSASKTYYDVVMPLLGFDEFLTAPDEFAYRPAGGKPGTYLFFYPSADASRHSRHRTGLQHLAFIMRSRSLVHDIHELVAATLIPRFGGEILHRPQVFPQYPQPYFATFWLDPWGLMLEAVCHHNRD